MPTLHLSGLDADLVSRVRAYARARGIPTPDAASSLLTLGLQMAAGRSAGGAALAAQRTPTERTQRARDAAAARWARHRHETP